MRKSELASKEIFISSYLNKKNSKNIIKAEPLKYTNNIQSTFDVFNPVLLQFETPLADIDIFDLI